jgi:hypothetical protein
MRIVAYKGVVKGKKVLLAADVDLPDGTEVIVSPIEMVKGSPAAVLAAMKAPPHLRPEDIDEFERLIEAGQRPVSFDSPFPARKRTK